MMGSTPADRFEAYLRRHGTWYQRPNVTVHYAEGYGFWDNYKGYESRCYKTFKGFVKWRDYSIPNEFSSTPPATNERSSS